MNPSAPPRILFVGDSHANNLDVKVLEKETNTIVDRATAYTADKDLDAKFPMKNLMKVVPERLMNKEYSTLVIQGGCNEISNLKITKDINVKHCEEKVRKSRTKIFNLAQSCLKNNPCLKKVIILKSLPRYRVTQ